ncbi:GAF domain-containing protein [Kozakia baliensis]|uniref:GAF domain-containing protein n=1 Tax=Kozakia baliensis TaxID=153496 RepID=UPI0004967A76|nr:GAF domain-containing protein [Kozakia baliensis]
MVLEAYRPSEMRDADLNDLAMAAACLCRASTALISLVDRKRQVFLGCYGADLNEWPIDEAICRWVVEANTPLVIGDMRGDSRTKQHKLLVNEPFYYFYAGVPIRAPSGHVVGTLCVFDATARPEGLGGTCLEGMEALSRQAMRVLHERRMGRIQQEQQKRTAEKTPAVAVEKQLRAEHAALQLVGDIGGIGTFELDLATNMTSISPEVCRIFGLSRANIYPIEALIACMRTPDSSMLHVINSREADIGALEAEYCIRRANDGAERWVRRRAGVERRADGKPIRLLGTMEDITRDRIVSSRLSALVTLGDELREVKTPRAAYELGARVLGEALGADRAGYAEMSGGAQGTITIVQDWTAPGQESLAGVYDRKVFADSFQFLERGLLLAISDTDEVTWLHRELEQYHRLGVRSQLVMPILAQGRLTGCLYLQSSAPRQWADREVAFLRAVTDRTQAAAASIEARRRQQTLHEELAHRLKNLLALVQALANQSLRGIDDREAVRSFERRLIALSSAHDLLMQRAWQSGDLEGLAREVLARIAPLERFRFQGPVISLGPNTATSFSLTLHELGTNAAKYGALSNESGHVDIRWHLEEGEGGTRLILEWAETGGPRVVVPSRLGFGSRLLKSGFGTPGANVLEYPSEGCRARFSVPLAYAQEN